MYAAAATFGVFTLVVGYLVVRAQRRQPALGREGLIGEIGEVRQRIVPGHTDGKVFVHGEYWNADAAEALEVGERVEVDPCRRAARTRPPCCRCPEALRRAPIS